MSHTKYCVNRIIVSSDWFIHTVIRSNKEPTPYYSQFVLNDNEHEKLIQQSYVSPARGLAGDILRDIIYHLILQEFHLDTVSHSTNTDDLGAMALTFPKPESKFVPTPPKIAYDTNFTNICVFGLLQMMKRFYCLRVSAHALIRRLVHGAKTCHFALTRDVPTGTPWRQLGTIERRTKSDYETGPKAQCRTSITKSHLTGRSKVLPFDRSCACVFRK
uniref:Uncharacterized protein n=1 Tax=Timema tahoe TaxID=61484 RepID=A0A7R9IDQ4_9NEOP|nr:unnamed protein product [Timema tahoe]